MQVSIINTESGVTRVGSGHAGGGALDDTIQGVTP